MEMISEDKLRHIAGAKGFDLIYTEKDYALTAFLFLAREVKGIYLKGGTALNKIFLNHTRLSEDLDFAVMRDIPGIRQEIELLIRKSGLFTSRQSAK